MESCRDFIPRLGYDLSTRILMSLNDPSDIIRFSAVSTSWRDFAIENGLSKQLCQNKFPELLMITNIIKEKNKRQARSHKTREQQNLERDHNFFAYLARGLASSSINSCISTAISASSTGNYPEESLQNTLEPREMVGVRASYWSSTGQTNPTVPEKLVYKLISNICVVTEIRVQPFQEQCSEDRSSIYSPRAVRFRMGYPKSPIDVETYGRFKYKDIYKFKDKTFSWTYISPEFPMAHENSLQIFKLPEPVLCIGGILQIELLGRVESKETDNMYYIGITHVQVVGRPLSPGFDVEIIGGSGKCRLHYYPGVKYRFPPRNTKVVHCRRAYDVLGEGEKFILNSMFQSGLTSQYLAMTFICLLFLVILSKVPVWKIYFD